MANEPVKQVSQDIIFTNKEAKTNSRGTPPTRLVEQTDDPVKDTARFVKQERPTGTVVA